MVDAMNTFRRELTPQLADFERQAKKGVIQERVWLAIFQYVSYPGTRQQQLEHMLDCTKVELKRLGVL